MDNLLNKYFFIIKTNCSVAVIDLHAVELQFGNISHTACGGTAL